MYTYIHTYMHAFMHAGMYVYARMYVCIMYECMYVRTYVWVFMHESMCMSGPTLTIFFLASRFLLYAPSHRQDCTYHGLCYTVVS